MSRRGFSLLSLMAFVAVVTPLHAWDWQWVHQFNSSVFISAWGGAADGSSVYASGAVFGDLPGAAPIGGVDGYVRKLDHAGDVLWTRRVGTRSYDNSQGVTADAQGAYVTGITCGAFPGFVHRGGCDAYVARLSPEGAMVWVTQFGTSALDYPYEYGAITAHPSGVYVAGKTEGTFPGAVPAGGPNTFLARLDRVTGALLWVQQFGIADPFFFGAGGVGADDTGVATVANSIHSDGTYTAEVRKYNFDGTLQWARIFDSGAPPCGHPVFGLASHRGHVYLIGQTLEEWALATCEPQPYGQSFVIGLLQKLDANGHSVWQRRIKAGNPDANGGSGLRFTGAKVVHVTDLGVFVGANVRHADFAGHVDRTPPSDRSECGDPGAADNAVWKGFDGYVRRYDLDGNVVWTHQFGSSLYELVAGLGSDGSRVYAAGLTRCVVEEGVDPESGAPVDAFVVGLAIEPTTPAGRIQLIVGRVETLSDAERLSSGDFSALAGHLETALAALADSNAPVAKHALRAFVNLIAQYQHTNRLTTVEAQPLIEAANAIADAL